MISTHKDEWRMMYLRGECSRDSNRQGVVGSTNCTQDGARQGLFATLRVHNYKASVTLCVSHSVVSDSATPGTIARQAPLSMEFSRQEYWSELPFPSPGNSDFAGSHFRAMMGLSQLWTEKETMATGLEAEGS